MTTKLACARIGRNRAYGKLLDQPELLVEQSGEAQLIDAVALGVACGHHQGDRTTRRMERLESLGALNSANPRRQPAGTCSPRRPRSISKRN